MDNFRQFQFEIAISELLRILYVCLFVCLILTACLLSLKNVWVFFIPMPMLSAEIFYIFPYESITENEFCILNQTFFLCENKFSFLKKCVWKKGLILELISDINGVLQRSHSFDFGVQISNLFYECNKKRHCHILNEIIYDSFLTKIHQSFKEHDVKTIGELNQI